MEPFSPKLVTYILITFLIIHVIEHFVFIYLYTYLKKLIKANSLEIEDK